MPEAVIVATPRSPIGQPAGESGNNLGRAVAVLAGLDHLPGVTVNRSCSSSLQTTRMALHAIRASEGSAFISAGVETVSRYASGSADNPEEVHGVGGIFQDFFLASAYAGTRTLQFADGPDEAHKNALAKAELRRQREER
ncbi:hypothetical protein [Nocardioides antri]|uniref:thiolase family protein n=1 Tax=Nocardioides antri TaxID=2607659 RepID=UPI003F65D9D8